MYAQLYAYYRYSNTSRKLASEYVFYEISYSLCF